MTKPLAIARHQPDYIILACVAFLILFGFVMLSSASANLGQSKLGDNYFYLRHQFIYGFLIGLVIFFVTSKIYYGVYEKLALPFLILSIILLLLIFSPLGIRAGGALRWLTFGPFTVQPSELLKIASIIYFAAWLSGDNDRQKTLLKGFLPFIAVLAGIGAILLKQSSTSTFAIIMATACVVYFASGARLSYLLGAFAVGILGLLIVIFLTPYRLNRITTYLNPGANQEGASYHINQALIAIGSGGLTGVGFGQSTTKISYLPEPIGDSIFAVIAEELGFIGATTVIILFAVLVIRILMLALRTEHKFGRLILVGFGSLIGMQAFINIAAISGLIPLTGMPLPFISYGSSALVSLMAGIGIVANISSYTK